MSKEVRITGLKELNSALRQMDADLPKQLQQEFKRIATTVAQKVQSKVPRRTGRAASSVKPRGAQRGASIAVGGSRAEYYPWLDFGGSTGKGHISGSSGSGSVKRPVIPQGRYLYPTLAEENDRIREEVDAVLARIAQSAGFDQRGSN
jgi:hypothetical protein